MGRRATLTAALALTAGAAATVGAALASAPPARTGAAPPGATSRPAATSRPGAAARLTASPRPSATSRPRAAARLTASPRPSAASRPRAAARPAATPRPAAAAAADTSLAAAAGADLAWTLPAGWRDVGPRLTQLGAPTHRLAAATFDLRQDDPDGNCSPATARRQLPPHGALVFLLESREWEGTRPRLPPRPARFRLPAASDHECFGRARVVWWGENDRSFTAVVLLGRRAGATRRAQAEALLDSLAVQPIPPPPPPAGWRTAISAADSLRVPPGWSAYTLKRQRGVARPRVLFRVANARVVLRVVEHRRGPASAAFPPASKPLVFDARRRAGMSFRGYRISLRIFPRAGATAQDLDWAELSARSLGVSSVGRG